MTDLTSVKERKLPDNWYPFGYQADPTLVVIPGRAVRSKTSRLRLFAFNFKLRFPHSVGRSHPMQGGS